MAAPYTRYFLRRTVLFCFIKQDTAYEMRISDWSSDVCSSDLLASFADQKLYEPPVGFMVRVQFQVTGREVRNDERWGLFRASLTAFTRAPVQWPHALFTTFRAPAWSTPVAVRCRCHPLR